jgi:NAD(P)-dependent dehydrogenase (short-subunit alcohol dehydrogenase family)
MLVDAEVGHRTIRQRDLQWNDLVEKLACTDGVPYDSASPEQLDETVRLVEATGRRIVGSVVDTRDYDGLCEAVSDRVAELGRLDVIVANAGISAPQVWNEITPADFRDVTEINVTGTWNTVMAGAQKIIDGGRGGSIILISSAAGIKLQPFMIHYTASKHAVTGKARAFAAELGKHSIRVNSVHPGAVNFRHGFRRHDRGDRPDHGDQPSVGSHDHAVPAGLDGRAGGHRQRGALACKRRVETGDRHRDVGRLGCDAVLRYPSGARMAIYRTDFGQSRDTSGQYLETGT